MDTDRYEFIRNRLMTIAELARESCAEMQEFFDSIPLHEPAATSRDVVSLAMAVRAFREASTAPLGELAGGPAPGEGDPLMRTTPIEERFWGESTEN